MRRHRASIGTRCDITAIGGGFARGGAGFAPRGAVVDCRDPWSLLGLLSAPARAPWRDNWLSLSRVKDWLALLQITVTRGMFAVFLPPLAESKNRRRFAWLENAGRRWWPLAGGVYFLLGIKRRAQMRLITPSFRKPPPLPAQQQMRP